MMGEFVPFSSFSPFLSFFVRGLESGVLLVFLILFHVCGRWDACVCVSGGGGEGGSGEGAGGGGGGGLKWPVLSCRDFTEEQDGEVNVERQNEESVLLCHANKMLPIMQTAREAERERETETQRGRDRDRETDRQRQRQTEAETETDFCV